MSRKGNVSKEKVIDAITSLRNEKISINVRNVRDRIGGGDAGKVSSLIQLFLEEEAKSEEIEVTISDDLKEKIRAEILANVQQARLTDQRVVGDLQSRWLELNELLLRSEQDRVDLAETLETAKAEKAKAEGEHRSQLDLLRERLEAADEANVELGTQNRSILQQLSDLRVSAALLGEENNRLKADLAHLEQSHAQCADESVKFSDLRISVALTEDENKRLKAKLAEFEQLQGQSAEESKKMQSTNTLLEKELAAFHVESKMQKVSVEKAEKQLKSLMEENRQHLSKLERWAAETSAVREANARLETRLIEAEKSNGILQERLNNRTSGLTSSSVTTDADTTV